MSENQTRPTGADVTAFLDAVSSERRRGDARAVVALMRRETGQEPAMWGPSIIGFGSYHYRYASGREGDAPAVGLSPHKANLALYGLTSAPSAAAALERLGPHKTGVGCLYVTRLDTVDLDVLAALVRAGYEHLMAGHAAGPARGA
ncbi:DUF1801 domain-containing protein [Specibacter cremeus]|uniref:DUF1801 domain-containing protein n=1 Tax=Specibacter cremeus TaxID=1629051 RepID=UPI000F7980B5|nr:DUF1801 domain-containing protein [Specibacter cremeus]